MALLPDAVFGAQLAAAAGSTDPVGMANWIKIAAVINAQIKQADVDPTAGSPPMSVVVSGTTYPVAGTGKNT